MPGSGMFDDFSTGLWVVAGAISLAILAVWAVKRIFG